MRVRLLVCAVIVALAAAACGSNDATTVAVEPPPTAAPDETAAQVTAGDTAGDGVASATGPGDVPDVEMIDVHTGASVNLQSVVDGSAPLLFWFWAPH